MPLDPPPPRRPTVVGLGEILWDVFPDGPRFGGAPANFACSAAELAGDAVHCVMAGSVGSDDLGRRALKSLTAHGVDIRCVSVQDRPTGQVLVTLDAAGQPGYEFAADTAWDNLVWSDYLRQLAESANAVCFGTLGQRSPPSRDVIQRFVRAMGPDCLRVLDVNLRPPFWSADVLQQSLPLASVLKLNDAELPIVAAVLGIRGSEREMLEQLQRLFELEVVALTRGPLGAVLLNREGEYSESPAEAVRIADTVGAGDAYTAALVIGLLNGRPLASINDWAVRVAAFVCSQPGATPRFPDSLRLSSDHSP